MKQVYFFIFTAIIFTVTAQESKPVKVIHFKELQKILPTTPPAGFTRDKPKGQTTSSSGVSTSIASVEFTALKKEKQWTTMDDGRQDSVEMEIVWSATIEISDYAGMGEAMTSSLQTMMNMQYENESEDGYEKSTIFDGYKGIEKSRTQQNSKSCGLQLVVGDRFFVNAIGNDFSDITILHTLLRSTNLKTLATLK